MPNIRDTFNLYLSQPKGSLISCLPADIFNNPTDYLYQIKEDGCRYSLELNAHGDNYFIGRNKNGKSRGVAFVKEFMRKLTPHWIINLDVPESLHGTLLDGEWLGGEGVNGKPSKEDKQIRRVGGFVGFKVFDIMWLNGDDIREYALVDRLKLLTSVVSLLGHPKIKEVSCNHTLDMDAIRNLASHNIEGAVKLKQSKYISKVNRFWWKAKSENTVDGVVMGYTESTSGGSGLRGVKSKPSGNIATLHIGVVDIDGTIVKVASIYNVPPMSVSDYKRVEGKVVEFSAVVWKYDHFSQCRFIKFRPDKCIDDCLWIEQVRPYTLRYKAFNG